MSLARIKERAARLPRRPGAYLFQDSQGKVIYVGKAKDLRHRVASYFRSRGVEDPKTRLLLEHASALDYIATDSEPEALLLEMNLIKEHRPRYNVRLRDDKKYPFIKITLGEPYPRALVTRRVVSDGGRYFGPYTDASALRKTLRDLGRVFGVRSCSLRLPRQSRERACLNYDMKRCLAPCVPHCGEGEYRRQVESMCAFLAGRGESLVRELDSRMRRAARERRFEEAARLRDSLHALERVMVRQRVTRTEGGERDVMAVAGEGRRGVGSVLRVREGRMVGRDHFPLSLGGRYQGPEATSAFLKEYYGLTSSVPAEIVVDHAPPDREAISRWLSGRRGKKVRLLAPVRGEKAHLVRLAKENAELRLREEAGEPGRRLPGELEELREILGLPETPRHIEGMDISTSHGREPVGSLVVVRDGRRAPSEYRRFRLAYRGEADDTGMVRELVERHYRRLLDEGSPLPDLLVVDGGRGQLGAARRALRGLGLTRQVVIALAKREEEIHLEGRREPLGLPPEAGARRLLIRIRDEAHRLAVGYHRRLRGEGVRRSRLDEIPGLGPARKKALLRTLGSLRRIEEAEPQELARVPGIGPELARRLHAALRRGDAPAGKGGFPP